MENDGNSVSVGETKAKRPLITFKCRWKYYITTDLKEIGRGVETSKQVI